MRVEVEQKVAAGNSFVSSSGPLAQAFHLTYLSTRSGERYYSFYMHGPGGRD